MIPITQQLDEFLDAWSTVKHELSDSAAIQVREARHACRNSVRAAQICCHLLVRQIQAKKGKQEIAATIASIRDELTRALNELDAFAALVTGPAGEKTQLIAPRTTI
jgi:hypothetical protein